MQSIDPLVVHNDGTIEQQESEINVQELNMLMETTGLKREQLITRRGSPPPLECVDQWKIYKYGRSLVNPDSFSSLGTQMFLLNKWYLDACAKKEQWLLARVRPEHYFNGYDLIHIEFNELHQLLHQDALDKSLLNCWYQ